MTYLKSIARISKSKINLLFKVHSTETKVTKKVVEKDLVYDYCLKMCNNSEELNITDYSKVEYEFEYIFNGMNTEKFSLSLSKSMIKTYLYLHFLTANKSGVRKNLSYSSLAKSLGVSVVTMKKNLNRLTKLNFIWITNTDKNLFDIVIVDEYKNHESTAGGYITMSLDMLNHILSFDNVNELKIELKKALWCDAKVNCDKFEVSFNKDNLLSVLPSYIRPYKQKELLESNKSMFKFENGTLNYSAYKTKEELVSPLYNDYKSVIEGFFEVSKMPYSKYHYLNKNNVLETKMLNDTKTLILDDLTNLAIQYNLNLVLRALQEMYVEFGGEGINLAKSPPRFVRYKIQTYIALNKLSA